MPCCALPRSHAPSPPPSSINPCTAAFLFIHRSLVAAPCFFCLCSVNLWVCVSCLVDLASPLPIPLSPICLCESFYQTCPIPLPVQTLDRPDPMARSQERERGAPDYPFPSVQSFVVAWLRRCFGCTETRCVCRRF
ncbi:hypothetical protein AMAG_19135 [Allomyces macrogynus ATCC 38327]|uniref:Uncharacterized protein n=1 Tax=Allomyces macrogynus (strain ATCC 38327) TaxID=578462 RepID=A0A0L0SPD3_ALLM3|nr:hypothetical protein AMAG_19135 [Allomyces macrogynus ATCC 38327]|eukprot:KNE64235.1 hypothetical protein AMAG_19135 [Allomyces macrogynus ATCC 38327]